MTALAEKSSSGELSSFSGVFRVSSLNEQEKEKLEELLKDYRENEDYDVRQDLDSLVTITSEVRAITNQAVILHGERIKKAQKILKSYQDGAFTAWLIATYGNRQTPYNFLQYYEFYMAMPTDLHPKIDEMPRQAVYTLASRSGDIVKKEEIVKDYNSEPKKVLIEKIRKIFPLPDVDKRLPNYAHQAIHTLQRLQGLMEEKTFNPTAAQRKEMLFLLRSLQEKVEEDSLALV